MPSTITLLSRHCLPTVLGEQGKFDDFRGVEFSYGSMVWSPYNCADGRTTSGASQSIFYGNTIMHPAPSDLLPLVTLITHKILDVHHQQLYMDPSHQERLSLEPACMVFWRPIQLQMDDTQSHVIACRWRKRIPAHLVHLLGRAASHWDPISLHL